MSKMEIAKRVANVHNSLAQIMVSGDNTIVMGGVLIELRELVKELHQDIKKEEEAEAEADADSGSRIEEGAE